MGWKDRLSFLKVAGLPVNINGEEILFFPLSTGALFRLESLSKEVALAFSVLFQDQRKDAAFIDRNAEGKGSERIFEAASDSVIAFRSKERREAIDRVVKELFRAETQQIVADLLMDSMKDQFPDPKQRPPAKEFLNEIPVEVFTQMAKGLISANKGILGPFASLLESDLVGKAASTIRKKLDSELSGLQESDKNSDQEKVEGDGTTSESK